MAEDMGDDVGMGWDGGGGGANPVKFVSPITSKCIKSYYVRAL